MELDHNGKVKINDLVAQLLEANEKLIFQNQEKEKRAAELVVANRELVFQNEEKEKRAAELVVANSELVFQNLEKEKRAAELVIANEELVFQNEEKEKRAAELVIANEELIIQNQEKERRTEELVMVRETLFNEKELLAKTLISIGDAVISTDKNKNILFLNRIAEDLTGWTQKEAVGRPVFDVFRIRDEELKGNSEDIVENVLSNRKILSLSSHTVLISKEGNERYVEDSAAPIIDEKGDVAGVVIIFRDYTEKWERLNKIEYLNFHDDLTGLYNRRFFQEELQRLDTARNLPLTIIMGDINGLKLINDSFGHLIGDQLLQKSAESIRSGCRKDEIIARIGGDEFAIILPNAGREQADIVVSRIMDNLNKHSIKGIEVSLSFGYGTKTEVDQDIQKILKESEDYMYRHKLFESSSMRSKTINLITKTLFEKNGRELIHSTRVSEICAKLSEQMGFEKDKVDLMSLAGLMHDIGKIGIDEEILNKPGALTNEEFIQIQRHPEIGFRILNAVAEFSEIRIYVLQHHEKWDGSGYPQGLKGEQISVGSRIITISDAYEAMTAVRPYRDAMDLEYAVAQIKKYSGTQFDPAIARVFIEKVLQLEY